MAAVMLVSMTAGINLSAYAKQADGELIELESYVNPMYEDLINDDSFIFPQNEDASQYYEEVPGKYAATYTLDKATAYVRDKMVARENVVEVNVVTEKSISSAASYICKEAMSQEMSVSTTDGDYLHWNMVGYRAAGNIIKTGAKNEYHLILGFEYLTTASQEKEVTKKINSVVKSLKLDGKSDYRKLRLIHNFVCETAKYDYEHWTDSTYKQQFSTYGALIKGETVCQGYATLFYRLCSEVGVSCRVITSIDHAWNIAKVGNKYYNIDTTWDDTQTDYYPENENGYWSDDYVFDWFMIGSEDFIGHDSESDYNTNYFKNKYPISTESYVCTHPTTKWITPKNADCEKGFDKTKTCTDCDEVIKTAAVPAGSEHNYVEKTVAATCTAKGYTSHTCSVCQSSYKDKETPATGHKYKKSTVKATMSKDGKITNACTVCKDVKSTSAIPKISSIALSATQTYYNGKVKTPGVTVKDSKGKTLKKGTDYDVTLDKGRKNVGRYAVTIKLKGNYSGSKTLYFNIIPKGISKISKITPKSKGFTVQWPTQKTQTTGYQIQYSTNKNMSNAKTITMAKPDYYAKSITGLAANKTYYVRIRTYKVTKFDSKNYNIYSPWCAVQSVTTKK